MSGCNESEVISLYDRSNDTMFFASINALTANSDNLQFLHVKKIVASVAGNGDSLFIVLNDIIKMISVEKKIQI